MTKNGYSIQTPEEVRVHNCNSYQKARQSLPTINFSSACMEDPLTS
jgi:hypothetical protein